ncbi:MAG: FIST C-terminal domain-containing protein [Bacteroidetes bacterium]|nr:FIST C-terminal domain-containing protein [Bacteroidota bacterium]
MKSISFAVQSPVELEKKLKELIPQAIRPTLAISFCSVKTGIREVAGIFGSAGIPVFGSSSCGEILAGTDDQAIYEQSIVVSLIEIAEAHFRLKAFSQEETGSFSMGEQIGHWAGKTFDNPVVLIVASGLKTDGQQLVKGILEKAGKQTVMFGGLAGDDGLFEKTFVFSDTEILDNGANVLVLDGDHIIVNGLATSGWIGLGKDLTVTRSEGNIVYSIDNEPALEVYKKYLNVRDEDLPAIGVEYPLMIRRSETDHSLRAVMEVEKKNKALIFAGTVPQGSIVRFSSSPGFEVMETTKEKIYDFFLENPETDILLIFSCMARHLALGPVITEELTYATELWKTPMTGFFTYGEIGTNKNKTCDFYNQTYTLVVIKEK